MIVSSWWLAVIVMFLVGISLGSFLNEQVGRAAPKARRSWFWRSKCASCGKRLSWWQVVPLISQLWLGGKCFHCRRQIPRLYWWTELGVGATTAALFWRLGDLSFLALAGGTGFFSELWQGNAVFLIALAFSLVLWFAALYDGQYMLLPDWLMLPSVAVALVGRLWWVGWGSWGSWWEVLLGGLVPAAFFALLVGGSQGKWMGGGDIRLAALVGFLFGWQQALVAFLASFVLGALVGLALVAMGRAHRRTALPYAPFLAVGAFLAVLWGNELAAWYLALFL